MIRSTGIALFLFVLFTFCQRTYKTNSNTLGKTDKQKVKKDKKELREHLDKQEQKAIETEDLNNKYQMPSKRKKRGEVPPQETFY